MSCVIGIDGGGSTTRALIARPDGVVLGSGTAGGSNVYTRGGDAAIGSIFEALDRAFHDAKLDRGQTDNVRACFAGIAGAGASGDAADLSGRLARRLSLPPSRCLVDRDVCNAHAGALAGEPGAVLIAGTGSVCFGRTRDGRSASAGGWGTFIDDPGSGGWFGLRGMAAIVRAADGRGADTSLARALLDHLGVDSPMAMLGLWRGSNLDRQMLAGMAPLILAAAENGDAIAQEMVELGAGELAAMVAAVRARLVSADAGHWPVVPVGGLVQASEYFRNRIGNSIKRAVAGVDVRVPVLSPGGGSLLLALELDGIKATAALIDRIKATARP
jgi:N-acetylglucosamine kinase-like BadF-type ATPase